MDKVFEKGGSWVKVEFSTSSTCNSARQPRALAIWVECVERGVQLPLIKLFYYPNLFAQYRATSSRTCMWSRLADISTMKTLFISSCHLCCCKKSAEEPPFPRYVSKTDRLIIYSLYQPTPFRSEAAYSLLPATIACYWPCFFSLPILLYLGITSVSASGCTKSYQGRA